MSKIICLDYDGTYTDFPEIFDAIIPLWQKSGCEVILCTLRYEREEDAGILKLQERFKLPVYYTGRQAKQFFLAERMIFPHIWIDDNPKWIIEDAF